jgi:hypothetical protein
VRLHELKNWQVSLVGGELCLCDHYSFFNLLHFKEKGEIIAEKKERKKPLGTLIEI